MVAATISRVRMRNLARRGQLTLRRRRSRGINLSLRKTGIRCADTGRPKILEDGPGALAWYSGASHARSFPEPLWIAGKEFAEIATFRVWKSLENLMSVQAVWNRYAHGAHRLPAGESA